MNWITITWPLVAGAILTLGLIELCIGVAHPPRAARFMFSLSAFAMALGCGNDLALMHADSIESAATALRRGDFMVGAIFVSLTVFIWAYFGTGRKWLALACPILYAVSLTADLVPGGGMIWVAVVDELIIGFTDLKPSGHLDRMYVHPEHEGRGVASALLNRLEDTARCQGLTKLFTEASITAKPLFERRGFEVLTAQVVEHRGEKFTNFKMEKHLAQRARLDQLL
jgi:GNAT superfamily N-acetyltransferase